MMVPKFILLGCLILITVSTIECEKNSKILKAIAINTAIGVDCSSVNVTCFNGGSCLYGVCICPQGYTGSLCETRTLCASMPCLNGGICVVINDSYVCTCQPGFYGQNCQDDLHSNCALALCANGASCYKGKCYCAPGYTGINCEYSITNFNCTFVGCNNGGRCVDGKCICPFNYYGSMCEYSSTTTTWQTDLCYSMPCLNGGACISSWGMYKCSCPPGYTGFNCEQKVNNSFLSNLIQLILQSIKIKFNLDLNLDWYILRSLLP